MRAGTRAVRPDGPVEVPAPAGQTRRPLGRLRRTVREIGLGLITLGVVVLLFLVYQLFGTNLTEEHHQAALSKQFNAAVAAQKARQHVTTGGAPVAETLPSVPEGGPVDHIVIPAIGVNKIVVEGTAEADLSRGPGHYKGTAYPGQDGNTGIAGHRTTFGAPFFELNNLKPGDPVYLTDLTGHTWVYVVSQAPVVVSPSDVAVLDPTPFPQLTLTTCNPRFEATSRLVVYARLQGPPMGAAQAVSRAPALRSLPGHATPAEQSLGHGQSQAWFPTIGYGVLVTALWVAARLWINRTRRWRRVGAYVVGIAVCLVPLWFCFENAVRLLPPSI